MHPTMAKDQLNIGLLNIHPIDVVNVVQDLHGKP